jgi:hypothetical protein
MDLPNKMVQREEAKKYCDENNLLFMETSAKEGTGVEEVFNTLGIYCYIVVVLIQLY